MPALAFIAGFGWDSITLGRVVLVLDLWILAGYYLGAGVVLALLSRQILPPWRLRLRLLVQFFFGGLFSALVVLYFKSSGGIVTFCFVILLVLLLVANEFLEKRYESHQLSWTLFTICGIMLLNFLLPHLFHSVHPGWFFLSTFIGLAAVIGLRRLLAAEIKEVHLPGNRTFCYRDNWLDMVPAMIAATLLIILYIAHLIPPVPLVLKEQVLCHDLQRQGDQYSCQQEVPGFFNRLGLRQQRVHYTDAEKIYCLVAVFAPSRVTVDLEQRWWWWDEVKNVWQGRGTVALPMTGGRKQGWRTYSFIRQSVEPGKWKVETAVQGGAVLGYKRFVLLEAEGGKQKKRREFRL